MDPAITIALAVALASHMGLCSAVASRIKILGPTIVKVIRCPKCLTFWLSALWLIAHGQALLASVMVSLLCSYAVLWITLLLELLYKIYTNIWRKMINP